MTGHRRILAVNPNTSEAVTRAFVEAARAIAPDGVEIDGVTGRFGARIVSVEAENLIAGHSALDLVAAHRAGYDGVILAISFDTGLLALREILDVPVVGITEAALLAAQDEGRRVGAIIFGETSRPLYERTIARICAPVPIEAVEVASAADYLAPETKDDAVLAAVERLTGRGAEAVVICGTAIVGMAARLQPRVAVPLSDGTAAVARCLQTMANPMRAAPSRKPVGGTTGLSPALAALLGQSSGS